MAHIRKYYTAKREVRYKAEISVKGTKPISKSFIVFNDAKIWAREEEAKLQRLGAGVAEHHSHTLSEAIDRYLKEYTTQASVRDMVIPPLINGTHE